MVSYFGSIAPIRDPEARFRVEEDKIALYDYGVYEGELRSTYFVPCVLQRPDDEHRSMPGNRVISHCNLLVTGTYDSQDGFILRGGITAAKAHPADVHPPVSTYTQALVADETYRYACPWAN